MEDPDQPGPQDDPGPALDDVLDMPGGIFRDRFRESLAGKPPPDGYRLWAYKLVRSDRRAGGDLRWPADEGVLVESDLSDGHLGGTTSPGVLAIARDITAVEATSSVGGSVLLTLALNPEDIIEERADGLLLARRAIVADADPIAQNLSGGIFRKDPLYRPLDSLHTQALNARERASFLGPEPLELPGLDTRRRVRGTTGRADLLAAAVAAYRQPPNDPYDLALALTRITRDEDARARMADVTVRSSMLQCALPWDRQVAVQRRVDGYLLEQFGRVDPRVEDPQRPMGHAEELLHTVMWGSHLLNMAETLIEYDIDYDDLADDPEYEFVQSLLPRSARSASRFAEEPRLMNGPVYLTGLGADNVPRCPELTAVYLPPAGQPQLVRLEADGPSSARERQILTGGPVTHVRLADDTRMLLAAAADAGSGAPPNDTATRLLARYPGAASPPGPVLGHAVIVGIRGDGTETDVPDAVTGHLARLGHPVDLADDDKET